LPGGIDLNNPLDAIPGAGLLKSMAQGLTPDGGTVPGYLSKALDEKKVKAQMIDGFEKFIQHLTEDNPQELRKIFLDILKEQINAKFKEEEGGGEFKKTIVEIVNNKFCKCEEPKEEPKEEVEGEEGDEQEGKDGTKPEGDVIKTQVNAPEANIAPPSDATLTSNAPPPPPLPPINETSPSDLANENQILPPPPPVQKIGGKSNKRITRKIKN
jgi:hypothetical protein